MKKKRGQGWSFDIMVASGIAMVAIITFYFFTLNYETSNTSHFNELKLKANEISSELLSEGRPIAWNATNVQLIGISSNGKINSTKLEMFYNLSTTNYNLTQRLFASNFEYFINFSEQIIIGAPIAGIGLAPSGSAINVYKESRFTIYNNKSATMYVTVWE